MRLDYLLILLAGLMLIPFGAHARTADEGELDDQSLVTIKLSLSVLPTIQISSVQDIRLAITDRSIDTSYSEELCVRGNTGDSYTIMASGTGTSSSSFALQNDAGEDLRFEVMYRASGSDNAFPMEPGKPSAQFSLPTLQFDCLKDLSSISVLFRSADLQRVSPGLYTGALTLVVSPI